MAYPGRSPLMTLQPQIKFCYPKIYNVFWYDASQDTRFDKIVRHKSYSVTKNKHIFYVRHKKIGTFFEIAVLSVRPEPTFRHVFRTEVFKKHPVFFTTSQKYTRSRSGAQLQRSQSLSVTKISHVRHKNEKFSVTTF